MQITIHRGTNQIGGCITEIITDTTRIFIDMGDNLPGIGTPMSAEEKHNYVATLFAENQRKHQAVFYTHGHTDHVGLLKYVPNEVAQYMSEGTKQLLVFKQEVLKEARKKQLKNSSTTTDEPIEYDEQLAKQIKASITWQRPKPHKAPKSIQIGDIRITPYFVSHSIYDASMLLIEADNKRILHMGDYREHSTLGKGLIPTLKTYIKQVDILITEGTMLTQPEFVGRTEEQISQRMADVMRAFKHVFVLTSATDYERLQSISNAAYSAGKDLWVGSKLLSEATKYFHNNVFPFKREFKYGSHPSKESSFVMVIGANNYNNIAALKDQLTPDETLLIYSAWDGYYKYDEQIQLNPAYRAIREHFTNIVDLHTPGHAYGKTIAKVITTLSPSEAIIGIHKDATASLTCLNLPKDLQEKIVPDNKQLDWITAK